jgi:serine/threonine protein kinase
VIQQPDNGYPRQPGNIDEMNSLIGKSLGKFEIVDRIGAGGMATVFKAYQHTLDRFVAIKVLPTYYADDNVFQERFKREARSVAKLTHPNIVQIHDFGEQDNVTYIVMEYVEGGTLKDRLKRPLPVPEAIGYVIQAAEGLDCAHRNNIIHRDVKPANMLLRKDGHLLLSDFGIAKILEGTTNLTRVGTGIGTPQYMSPEQGTGQAVDRRSDIYSLGIVLFHCLTGRVPFTADNPLSVTLKHLHDPLPYERMIAEGVPNPVVQVVLQMTAKQAQDRYQSAQDVIEALSRALEVSNLVLPRSRFGSSPGGSFVDQKVAPPNNVGQPAPGSNPGNVGQVQGGHGAEGRVRAVCFRCGALSDSTQVYCTTCGYELADKRASTDRARTSDGRSILARLSLQNGLMAGRSYRFHQDITTIGRMNGNDLIISGRTVSRHHARLWFENGRWWLADLQSLSGTLINGARIIQPTALNDGDVINFGDEIAIFNITYGS